jgi:hypothetical protein
LSTLPCSSAQPASFFEVRISEQLVRLSFSRIDWSMSLSEQGDARRRMECEIVFLRDENADQIDRVALEHVSVGDIDAVVVDDETRSRSCAVAAAGTWPSSGSAPAWAGRIVLELGAEDGGEVTDVLGDW